LGYLHRFPLPDLNLHHFEKIDSGPIWDGGRLRIVNGKGGQVCATTPLFFCTRGAKLGNQKRESRLLRHSQGL
jgi:hypothetical protein